MNIQINMQPRLIFKMENKRFLKKCGLEVLQKMPMTFNWIIFPLLGQLKCSFVNSEMGILI